MKKMISAFLVLTAGLALADDAAPATVVAKDSAQNVLAAEKKLSLAEARALIDDCIADPAKMRNVIQQLEAADQITFLADVNAAIAKLPGSIESRTATYLNVNRAAVLGASSGNKTAMLAEVFATVPLEALTVINEAFAETLLNAKGDPSKKRTEEEFMRIAQSVMSKVNERCSTTANPAIRSAFAALMLIHASDEKPDKLVDKMVDLMPDGLRREVRQDWLPAALGLNQSKTYEPMLAAADDIGRIPVYEAALRLAGPQLLESMLPNLVERTPIINTSTMDGAYAGVPIREEDLATQPPLNPADHPDPNPYKEEEPEPPGYRDQVP